MKRRTVGGDEWDAFNHRRIYFWQRGELRRLKRKANKRERREGVQDARGTGRDGD